MALPAITPRAPTSVTRADTVSRAVNDALNGYRDVLNTDVNFRSVQIDVKFNCQGQTVRAVVITTQGEVPDR